MPVKIVSKAVKKPRKTVKKLRKKTHKKIEAPYKWGSFVRGFTYFLLGASLVLMALALTMHPMSVKELALRLVKSLAGRIFLVILGIAYIIIGINDMTRK